MKIATMLICILACVAARAADKPNYAYSWPITTEGNSAAYQIELTPEIYAALTTPDLRDLDIVNAAGEVVPTAPYHPFATAAHDQSHSLPMFAIPNPTPEQSTTNSEDGIHLHIERGPDGKLRSLDAQIQPSSPTAGAATAMNETAIASAPVSSSIGRFDNATKIILDASHLREPILRLLIDWSPQTNATPHFSVSASDDLQSWRTLVPNAAIVRLTQDGNSLERHEVPLDNATHAYLMLTRLDGGTALPNLFVNVVTPLNAQQPVQRWLTAVADGVDETAPKNSDHAIFRYHLDAPMAINAINVQLADDNSVAQTHVSNQSMFDAKDGWTTSAGSFVAFRLRDGSTLLVNDPMQRITSPRSRNWRVDLAAPISHAPTLMLAYIPDRFVFLAQGAGPYRLIAGSATTRHNDAPVDVALNQLRAAAGADWKPPLATLGAPADLQGANALAVAAPPTPQPWKSWLLWGVLVAAAGVVAALALSLLREK